jgi:hypothetical protein
MDWRNEKSLAPKRKEREQRTDAKGAGHAKRLLQSASFAPFASLREQPKLALFASLREPIQRECFALFAPLRELTKIAVFA